MKSEPLNSVKAYQLAPLIDHFLPGNRCSRTQCASHIIVYAINNIILKKGGLGTREMSH